MEIVAQAVVGVLLIGMLVGAFLASKVWHWAHVTVAVLLFLSTLLFTFFAADVLRVRAKYLRAEAKAAMDLEQQVALNEALARGTKDPQLINRLRNSDLPIADDVDELPSVSDQRHALRQINRTLGRAWRNAQPLGPPNPQTGRVAVQIEFPKPLGIEEGSVLFVFEQGQPNAASPQEGSQYLGEFLVTAIGDQQLELESVLPLNPADPLEFIRLQRSVQSGAKWVLYETMPIDSHELFEQFTEEQLKQLLPAASLEEYLRDGSDWSVDDSEWVKQGIDADGNVVGPEDWDEKAERYVYRRRLRDYAFLFSDIAERRVELYAEAEAVREDTAKLLAANESAKALGQYRMQEQEKLKSDLAGVNRDRKAIESQLAALQQQIKRSEGLLEQTIAANAALAEQLASYQQAMSGGPVPAGSRGAVDVDAL